MFSFFKKKESDCCEVEIIEVKEDHACCDEMKTEDCCNESQNEYHPVAKVTVTLNTFLKNVYNG